MNTNTQKYDIKGRKAPGERTTRGGGGGGGGSKAGQGEHRELRTLNTHTDKTNIVWR